MMYYTKLKSTANLLFILYLSFPTGQIVGDH